LKHSVVVVLQRTAQAVAKNGMSSSPAKNGTSSSPAKNRTSSPAVAKNTTSSPAVAKRPHDASCHQIFHSRSLKVIRNDTVE